MQYSDDHVNARVPRLPLGWFPDYSDADNYLSPFFVTPENFLANRFSSPKVAELIAKPARHPGSG